jgi:hypothetical protein
MPTNKQRAPQEDSPSPPPLPTEPAPLANEAGPADVPIASLGSDSEEETDTIQEGSTKDTGGKGKRKAVDVDAEEEADSEQHPWQTVWSEESNGTRIGMSELTIAWYFWNTKTGEVTWSNPLLTPAAEAPPLPAGPAPEPAADRQAPLPARRQFGGVPEIDPALAFLLPPEARGGPSDPTAQSAMFNARTGRFTANDYMYNVEHLDEYNRMKRMNNQYFDQDAWERDMAEHHAKQKRAAEAGLPAKTLSKKDLVCRSLSSADSQERFKKQKQEKKFRGQAWLRD